MAHVVIIGGGFAGVWSAAGAALARETASAQGAAPAGGATAGAADLRITLISPNEHLVLRPRLYEPEPDLAKVELGRILGPIGVEHLRASVVTIDTGRRVVVTDGPEIGHDRRVVTAGGPESGHDRRVVVAGGREVGYDRLVLAAGSRLVRPEGLPGAGRLFDIDTLDGARRLAEHLRDREDYRAVVVGAGFVGLEAATELAARGRVLLVDRAQVVGDQLGPGPRAEIEAALDRLGVERRLGTTVTEVGDGYAVLSDGTRVEADAVVWSVGMRASELTRQISDDLDHLGRVPVDRHLRALPEVFAAGDTAAAAFDAEHTVMQACQHATPLGKVAGYNAAADLLGVPPRDFTPGPYVTCLDLGGAGGIFTRGWDRRVLASGAAGKEIKQRINQRIHPPVDDDAKILAAADQVYLDLPFFPTDEESGQPGRTAARRSWRRAS
ncbi:NAD(P)/FAD-dependent oxidoreductase [Nonomuraea angiospora]|uniref:NAD(P)/FAD-dependent oxidoreductase n=1 Tax=Nonomuraea angiospora TaxID=46172 RepID=UPI0037919CBB